MYKPGQEIRISNPRPNNDKYLGEVGLYIWARPLLFDGEMTYMHIVLMDDRPVPFLESEINSIQHERVASKMLPELTASDTAIGIMADYDMANVSTKKAQILVDWDDVRAVTGWMPKA